MTGSNAEHPWLMALRRQQRLAVVAIVGSTLFVLAVFAGVLIMLSKLQAGMGVLKWMLVVVLTLMLLLLGFAVRQMLTMRRWADQMLASDGMMCPKCRVGVDAVAEADEAGEGGGARTRCGKCEREYDAAELREFWARSVHEPMSAAQWWMHRYDRGIAGRFTRWLAPVAQSGPRRAVTMLAWFALVWAVTGAVVSFFTGTSILVGVLTFANMFLIMGGFMFIAAGSKSRVGESRHCSRCDYEQGPEVAAPARCPECGLDWQRLGGMLKGRPRRNLSVVAVGVAMLLLGAASMYKPALGTNWQLRILSTSMLIEQTINVKGFTVSEWVELRTRTLTPTQQRRLAEGLLEKRLRNALGWFSADEDNWFVAEITASALPEDLKQRYYREMLEAWIEGPAEAQVGDEVTVRLKFRARGGATNNPRPDVCIGGFFVGDDAEPRERQTRAIAGVMLDESKAVPPPPPPPPPVSGNAGSGVRRTLTGTRIEVRFVVDEPGAIRVRAPMWVFALPIGAGSQPIVWQEDGTPVIPAGSAWDEKRELEHVIRVR